MLNISVMKDHIHNSQESLCTKRNLIQPSVQNGWICNIQGIIQKCISIFKYCDILCHLTMCATGEDPHTVHVLAIQVKDNLQVVCICEFVVK